MDGGLLVLGLRQTHKETSRSLCADGSRMIGEHHRSAPGPTPALGPVISPRNKVSLRSHTASALGSRLTRRSRRAQSRTDSHVQKGATSLCLHLHLAYGAAVPASSERYRSAFRAAHNRSSVSFGPSQNARCGNTHNRLSSSRTWNGRLARGSWGPVNDRLDQSSGPLRGKEYGRLLARRARPERWQ